jgi:hypothetical protein
VIAAARGSPQNENPRLQPGAGQSKNTTTAFSSPSPQTVKPILPDMKFLPGRFLGILLTGRRYTHKESWLELGHARLADSAWKLRRLGWPVQMVEEVVATSDAGRSATIGVYYLAPEAIADAGECGQRYAAECARLEACRRAS